MNDEIKQRLNLGCGNDVKIGYVNLDIVKNDGVDVVHNLNEFPWPFSDNYFDEVYASHVLEHTDDLKNIMTEIKRICKNGARVVIRVPHFSCGVSYRDPTHKRLFSFFTFDYFEKSKYELPEFKVIKKRLNFTRQAFTLLNNFLNPIFNLNPSLYERLLCWLLPCAEILFVLEVRK